MATYAYHCLQHGGFDVVAPIGTASTGRCCPGCGVPARRVFTAPALARTPRDVVAALTRSERSRDAPDVVSALPPATGRARVRTAGPRAAGLPRP